MNVFEKVTARILQQLQEGTVPWHKPWSGIGSGAYSHTTGKPYSLLNQLLLGKPGEYITYTQCLKEGGYVRKGEKGSFVAWYKKLERTQTNEDGEDEPYSVPHLVYHTVFHIDQCEGIEQKYSPESLPAVTADEDTEYLVASFFDRTGCTLVQENQPRASYNRILDRVLMPLRDQFVSPPAYYGTMFHEMAHATGHESRLNRDFGTKFGNDDYSREELVAEITAAAALATIGMETGATVENSAAYIQSWLTALRNDPQMIVWAASRAQKALSIVLNMDEEEVTQTDDTIQARIVQQPKDTRQPPATASNPLTNSLKFYAARFAADCKKRNAKEMPVYSGSFVRDGRQYICDGHIAVAYDEPFAGLTALPDSVEGIDVERLMQSARVGKIVALPSLAEMREQYRAAKGKATRFTQYTALGDMYVNTAYLIRAMELTGIQSGEARMVSGNKPLHFVGEGCEAVVLPVLDVDGSSEPVWVPTLSA